MGNMTKGDIWTCKKCGLEIEVSKPCNEKKCDIVCCGQQLNKKEKV